LSDESAREKYGVELFRMWKEGKSYDLEGALKWVFPFLSDTPKCYYCSSLAEYLALYSGFSYYRESIISESGSSVDVMPHTLQISQYTWSVLQ
jgi:hypothetical protein